MAQKDILHDTTFPTAHDKDLKMQIRMLREKFRRFYPQVNYHAMNFGDLSDQTDDVPGEVPPDYVTEIDDLWGEPVATGQQTGLAWENPHVSAILDATEGDKRVDKGLIHAHINHEPSEKTLSRFGIDEKRVITITFLVDLLHDLHIVPAHGDRFFWRQHVFEILKWQRIGYWKNTSVNLYIHAVAKYARYGS